MRPAHQAREVPGASNRLTASRSCFNEARASSAGSNAQVGGAASPGAGFNEARASSAGSRPSMVAGQRRAVASMRPAHQAREVLALGSLFSALRSRFNEARASSAGSTAKRRQLPQGQRRFNEARASSAGSIFAAASGVAAEEASMRPAHQAREVVPGRPGCPGERGGFNEARASSAGSTPGSHARPPNRPASMRPAHQAREVRR